MDHELRNFLSALKTGQERLSAEITGLREEMNERFTESRSETNDAIASLRDELKKEIHASEKRMTTKIDHLDDRMAFIEKKTQDNERDIFILKNK